MQNALDYERLFQTAPERLAVYIPGEVPDRSTVASWFVWVFETSEGNPFYDGVVLEWCRRTTGFRYKSVIQNLFRYGGWAALKPTEQAMIAQAFNHMVHESGSYDLLADSLDEIGIGGLFESEVRAWLTTPYEAEVAEVEGMCGKPLGLIASEAELLSALRTLEG